jgi:hypothetical protein
MDWNSMVRLIEENNPKKETLLELKIEQEDKIREIVERRKIEHLVHFTRIDNLHSILQSGLIPRSMQQEFNLSSLINDEGRFESRLDCTSCSVAFPNYLLFHTFRECKFPGSRWAIIFLNIDILFSPSNIAYYYQTNAATANHRDTNTKELCSAQAFENMFCDSVMAKNRFYKRTPQQIHDNWTTDPQAEVLISDVIDNKYIDGVCFQNQNDVDAYILSHGEEFLDRYTYGIILDFYKNRPDCLF